MRTSMTILMALLLALAGCTVEDPGAGDDTTDDGMDDGAAGGTMEANRQPTCQTGDAATATMTAEDGLPLLMAQDGLTATTAQDQEDDVIRIGSMLPLTGTLADFGPDMESAVQLAIQEVNDLNELLGGRTVEHVSGDTKSSPADAPSEFQRLLQEDVVGVVGAASSGVTGSILPLAEENEVTLTTPASTSPLIGSDTGYFWRVPSDDGFQGKAMAQLLADDGCETVHVLAVDNDYGRGFTDVMQENLEANGGTVAKTVYFSDSATSFDTEADQATSGDFDALVFVGYPGQATPIFLGLKNSGDLGTFPVYFSEGVKSQEFISDVGDDSSDLAALRGFQGTTPATASTSAGEDFREAFEAEYGHEPNLFAAESYDATLYMILAMEAAGSSDPTQWAEFMDDVANPPGVQTSDLAQAFTLLGTGQDIDWVGAASDLEWNEHGEHGSGDYAFWTVLGDGTIEEGDAFTVER